MKHLTPDAKLSDRLKNITDLSKFIFGCRDADEMYARLTQGVCEHSDWDISSIQVLDVEAGKTYPIVRYDRSNDAAKTDFSGWKASDSPVKQVLDAGEPLVLLDAVEQNEFPGYRKDAIERGYHTVVVVPLEVKDTNRRQMVYSVASRKILDLDEVDIDFLKCVAELSAIAIRKMRDIKKEQDDAKRLREIVGNMTNSLARTLNAKTADELTPFLSVLFSTSWLAIDLTSGRMLFDHANLPPIPIDDKKTAKDELVSIALNAQDLAYEDVKDFMIGEASFCASVSALQIDDTHVGTLFLFDPSEQNDNEMIASQAGQIALSSFILRSFVEFRTRKTTARRLISRLISGEWDKSEDVLDEAHRLGFDLSEPSRLLILGSGDKIVIDDQTHSYILRTTQRILGPAISSIIDGQLVLLLSEKTSAIRDSDKSNFINLLKPYLSWEPLIVMSEQVEMLSDLVKQYASCVNTISVGRSMKALGWISARTVGAFPALMATADMSKVDQFLSDIIEPISRLGDKKSEVALHTIEKFLMTGRRYQETADALEIHVSTLRYRLEQIAERHKLDFDDPDVCFNLELAIRLMKVKNSYVS